MRKKGRNLVNINLVLRFEFVFEIFVGYSQISNIIFISLHTFIIHLKNGIKFGGLWQGRKSAIVFVLQGIF